MVRHSRLQTGQRPEFNGRQYWTCPLFVEWLSPFELSEAASATPAPAARASNQGCLPMPFAEYLQIFLRTPPYEGGGRTWRSDKRCAIPDGLAPILERLALTDESWMNLVRDFRRKFRRAAGTPESMKKEADKHGCRKNVRHRRYRNRRSQS